ncbi:MAG: delta-60 repeat domain-containing protein [Flavobacteriales bacterium]
MIRTLTLLYAITVAGGLALFAQPGAIDPTFDPGAGANDRLFCAALQADGKLLVAGELTAYDGVTRNGIARLNPDGSLDTAFDPGDGPEFQIYSMAVQPDGKILVGGQFNEFDGVTANMIVRLNPDGSVDSGFDTGTGADWIVLSIKPQSDGKILVGGNFLEFDGVPRSGIARLNADGSLDTSFDPGTGLGSTSGATGISAFLIQSDGRILIGGSFTSYDGVPRNSIARIHADGALDTSFDPGDGAQFGFVGVSDMALLPDGRIILGGDFAMFDGMFRSYLARVNIDGSLDASFVPGTGPDSWVNAIALQPDGKVVVGGFFNSFDDVQRNSLLRVNADGTLDTGYDTGTGMALVDEIVFDLVLQPDGKVFAAGEFTVYDGTPRNHIVRVEGGVSTSVQVPITDQEGSFVRPNPAEGTILLSEPLSGTVCDAQGRTVLRFQRDLQVDLSVLVPGRYLLRTEDGRVEHIIKL